MFASRKQLPSPRPATFFRSTRSHNSVCRFPGLPPRPNLQTRPGGPLMCQMIMAVMCSRSLFFKHLDIRVQWRTFATRLRRATFSTFALLVTNARSQVTVEMMEVNLVKAKGTPALADQYLMMLPDLVPVTDLFILLAGAAELGDR